ncbi:MAG TPA: hypothetical protein VF589_12265 [Allosphingosinicella sp.]
MHRKLTFDCSGMTFDYSVVDMPTNNQDNKFGDIGVFCRSIVRKDHVLKGPDAREDKRLDVPISKHSYVIFELPEEWTFSSKADRPGVTLGIKPGEGNPDSDAYGQLRYVTASTVSPAPIEKCRLVFFSAIDRDGTVANPYIQPINFNIVTSDGVAVVVDPDIRFPGNGTS